MPASSGWTARAARWCGGRAASCAHGQCLRLCARPLVAPACLTRIRKKRMIRSKPIGKGARLVRWIGARLGTNELQNFSHSPARLPLINAQRAVALRNGDRRV